MILSANTVAVIASLGLSEEKARLLIEALEADQGTFKPVTQPSESEAIERRREADRARQKAKRERDKAAKSSRDMVRDDHVTPSENVTLCHADDNVTPSCERAPIRAQVVNPSSSSLRSEESKNPPSFPPEEFVLEPETPPPKSKSKPAERAKRGTRLPDDWEPNERNRQACRDAGLDTAEADHAFREFKNFWLSRSRDATRINWDLVFENRAHDLGKFKREKLARQANPRGGGRGTFGLGEYLAGKRATGPNGTPLPD